MDWRDGVPYSNLYSDFYFTKFGARGQAQEIFLSGNGLPLRWIVNESLSGVPFIIGELGFGVGLNFFETLHLWRRHRSPSSILHYYSLEAHLPSPDDIRRALADFSDFTSDISHFLLNLDSFRSGLYPIDSQTFFHLSCNEALDALSSFPTAIDAWYLDGFAPSTNPQMWRLELLSQVADQTSPGGTFSTYTSAGWVRRNLEQVGFAVERVSGYGTKRHSMKGEKL